MSCQHCHEESCEKEEKSEVWGKTLYVGAIILLVISFIPMLQPLQMLMILVANLLAGYELLISGIKNLLKLNFEEDTLMTIAIIAAFCLGEYAESCLVIILYRLGEFLEDRAVERSEKNIEEIVEIKAENANRINEDGEIEVIDTNEVKVNDSIIIKPGEKVPVDAIILSGSTELDTSPLTGESNPIYVEKGQEILSGSINLTGAITAKVIRDAQNSAASQIVNLVYEATNNKGKTEKFITRFSKIYTPIVIIFAIVLAIVPPVLGNLDFKTWITRALIFLVASCPCSLVIAVPLSFFSCVGAISKRGMMIKGTKHIENLAKATVIAFDKTGTLTTGKMEIEELEALEGYSLEEVEQYIYHLETLSNHPISTAIKEQITRKEKLEVNNYQEIAGHGIVGIIQEKEVLCGNEKLLKKYDVTFNEKNKKEGAIYLVMNKQIAGYMTLKEEVRKETDTLIRRLKKLGIRKIMMLTGDNKRNAQKIASRIQVDEVKAELLPQDKINEIEKEKKQGETVIFIGDGINDSPVLAASNFGVAMGAGAEIAGNTADSILISNQIETLPSIIKIAKRSMNIIRFNILFSLMIKAIVLILGATGKAPIWSAILADTGVTFLTVVNSMRILKMKS